MALKSWRRSLLVALVAGLGLILTLGVSAFFAIGARPMLEHTASWFLDRPVHVGNFRVSWGRRIHVELGDLRIANTAGGSVPDMLAIGHLVAIVNLVPLFHGVVRYEKLSIDSSTLVLERAADGSANWKIGGQKAGDAKANHGLALIPKHRAQFPTLIDFVISNSRVVYRHIGSRDIDLDFKHAAISTPAENTPVRFLVDGTYNGSAVHIVGREMGSFEQMRDRDVPYKADINLSTPSGSLAIEASIEEPLDFEGVTGPAELDVSSLAGFLEIFGFSKGPDSPLEAKGSFTHTGSDWQLANLSGHFAGSPMTGNLGLAEGSQRQPDIFRPDLELSFFDFKQLKDNGNTSDAAAAGASKAPGLLVHGRLNAKQLEWGKIRLSDLKIQATVSDDQNQDVSATFGFLGGSASATGVIAFFGNGNISADAKLTGADLATGIVPLVAPNAHGITGKLDLKVKLHGTAFEDPIKTTTGRIELSISKGTIARELLDKGSTDLRSLFHDSKHMVPISCFHAEGHLKEGILHIDELRLDASAVQLHLHGLVDLARGQIDTVLHSRSGSVLALDHPLSIRGPLSRPSMAPAKGNDPSLPPDQRRFNRPDGCG